MPEPTESILPENTESIKKNTMDVYKEMLSMERNKVASYPALYTILLTSLAVLIGFYLRDEKANFRILLTIPPLMCIWTAFAGFNLLYLEALRDYIKQIESKIDIEIRNKNVPVLWFKDIFVKILTPNASVPLGIFVYIFFGSFLIYVYFQILKFWNEISDIIPLALYFLIVIFLFVVVIGGFYLLKYRIKRKVAEQFKQS